jgi:FdrA protein
LIKNKNEVKIENTFNLIDDKNLKVINIGVTSFYDALKKQKINVVHVDWRPPAGGDAHLIALLEKIG